MKRTLIYIATLWAAFACTASEPEIRTGDLLFEVGATSEMSGAITAATGDDSPLNFTHVGIAITCEEADSVLEATSNGGVRMTSLDEFLKNASRINDRPAVVAMRLSDTTVVAASVARARSFRGLPYDYSYRPNNAKMYCSELVWECFLAADDSTHLFRSRPMTFRAADGSMPDYWTRHFAALGMAVPEGVAGTNPNDMAEDPAVRIVWRWYD